MLEPKYRLPGYTCPWEQIQMNELFEEVSEKGDTSLPVLSVKQGCGTVFREQSDRSIQYDKSNLKNYKVIRKGDFIIHLRSFEGGLECSDYDGISSPAYRILRTNKLNTDLYKNYFRSFKFIEGKLGPAVVGIRDGRNIEMDTFWHTKLTIPPIEEQNAMADVFNSVEEVICILSEHIQHWEDKKKGVMQKIFSREVKFKDENGNEYPEWTEQPLSYYLKEKSKRNKNSYYDKYDVLSVSKDYGVINQIKYLGKSMAGEDLSNYKCVEPNDVIYTKSPLGAQPYGIIKSSKVNGIVSVLYAVYTCTEFGDSNFIQQYFSNTITLNNYLKPLVNIGAKHTMNVSNSTAISGKVIFPCVDEQRKIAECLSSIDDVIDIKKQKLETWKTIKKGLLQQMFV